MECVPGSPGWIVGPTYEMCRPEFLALREFLTKLGRSVYPRQVAKKGPLYMEIENGSWVKTKSADDTRNLQAEAVSFMVVAEGAFMTPGLIDEYLRGRLVTYNAWFMIEGSLFSPFGWYADLARKASQGKLKGWKHIELRTWENQEKFPGEYGYRDGRLWVENERLQKEVEALGYEGFMAKYGGKPSLPQGAVWRDLIEPAIHFTDIPYQASLPVYLAVDPGRNVPYAVEFIQVINEMVFNFDEIYVRGLSTPEICELVNEKSYEMVGGAIDIAARQERTESVETEQEIWLEKTGIYLDSVRVPITQGIDRHSQFLRDPETGLPRMFHDRARCQGIISEYGLEKYAGRTEGQAATNIPIDRDNHARKAITYFIVNKFGFTDEVIVSKPHVPGDPFDYILEGVR